MEAVNVTVRVDEKIKQSRSALSEAFRAAQEQSVANGTDMMTMDDIDAEIAAYRRENGIIQL